MNHKNYLCLFLLTAITFTTSVALSKDNPPLAPKGFVKLLHVDPHGGKVLHAPDTDFTKPGVKWQDWSGSRLVYEQTYKDYGSYRLKLDVPPAPTKSNERP